MKAIVPMLVMVVTVFILCWTPILIFEVTFHLLTNPLNNILLQVLQAFDIIGLQVFGSVKHIKTFCSLLAYVNRLILVTRGHPISQSSVSVVSILLYTVLCQKTSEGVSPRHCVNVKTKKSSISRTKKGMGYFS